MSDHESCENADVFAHDPYLAALRCRLELLSVDKRVAFAARCAQYLFPDFRSLCCSLQRQDGEQFLRILESIWSSLPANGMADLPIDEYLHACEAIEFGEDNCMPSWGAATDAVQALWLTLQACKARSSEYAALAGGCMLDRWDRELFQVLSRDIAGGIDAQQAKRINLQIRSHPSILAEVARHEKWITFLSSADRLAPTLIEGLRRV